MRVSALSRFLLIRPVTTCIAFPATLSDYHRHHHWFQQRSRTSLSSVADHKKPQEVPADENTRKEHHHLLGGDFAGYTTQYDARTGAAKPVPVYLVPPSLLEWGQHPKALEVIVSEDSTTVGEHQRQQWNRVCLTVLPETGCGVDNLEVQKTTQEGWNVLYISPMDDGDNNNSNSRNHCISLVRPVSSTSFMVETIFGVKPTATEQDEEVHRLRVTVTASSEPKEASIVKDIVMSYERHFDATSTRGARASGGGLDGASVARWMGPNIAQQGVKLLGAQPSDDDDEATNKGDTNNYGSPTILELPADVTLEYKTEGIAAHLRVSRSNGHSMQYKWIMGDLASLEVIST